MEKTVRNSNHELMRIIAMYMIVLIHANMYLGYFCDGPSWTFFNGLVNGICDISASVFIVASGYYGLKFSIRKLVKLECMMITLSILETVILCVLRPEQMQGVELLEQLVKSLLPFITSKHWYYSSYICLVLFSGYIQKFIDHLSQKEFERFLLLLLVLFSVIPTFFYFELVPDNGKGIVNTIMIYMMGRYIRMYKDVKLPKKAGLLFLGLWFVNGVSHEIFPVEIGDIYHHWCKDNSITNMVLTVIAFYMFKELKIQSKFINKAATCVFAVFALNGSMVKLVMEYVQQSGFESPGGILGALILMGIVFLLWLMLLLIGWFRELLLGGLDQKLGIFLENKIQNMMKKLQ